MAETKTRKKRTTYDAPIGVGEKIEGEPPRSTRNSEIGKVVDAIVEQTADGSWVSLDNGGRPASTVQSSVQSAAKRRDVNLETRTSEGVVYARVAPRSKGK